MTIDFQAFHSECAVRTWLCDKEYKYRRHLGVPKFVPSPHKNVS